MVVANCVKIIISSSLADVLSGCELTIALEPMEIDARYVKMDISY